jgi:serine/threonine protein kinase
MEDRIGQRLGNYQLLRLLGRGGFAEVYLGEHTRLNTHVAVKVLYTRLAKPDEVEDFQKEARTIAHLEHPHIVRVFDFDVVNDTPFLVMSYAAGGTLRQRHPKGIVLPLPTIISYVKQVADALQYAHDQRLVHRDIKPENMLVGQRDEVLLSDFGIATIAHRTTTQSVQEIAGTALYMAPEQFRGKPHLASDQYALGVVVYEWLCGRLPFSDGNFVQLGYQHTHEPPPPLDDKLPSISPDIEQVVMTALAKDYKQRFDSVRAFANALEQASQPKQPGPVPVPKPEPATIDPSQSQRPTVLTTSVIQLSQEAIADEVSANMSASAHDIVSKEVSTPATVPPPSLLPQQDPILMVQGKPKPVQRRISRRTVVLGLGLAGVAVAGGGITWWVLTPHPLYTYGGHFSAVQAVAWSPNGKRIASGSRYFYDYDGSVGDNTVQVWDADSGDPLLTYTGHSWGVNAVAWSPDGLRIASGSSDQTVQVWDAADGGNVYTYPGAFLWCQYGGVVAGWIAHRLGEQ